jgi:hypothetical protein
MTPFGKWMVRHRVLGALILVGLLPLFWLHGGIAGVIQGMADWKDEWNHIERERRRTRE